MAEYYPLLAKAIGSLPNSTPESRRVVYERARKALIGQLRNHHPPVADEDIEKESVALDKAVERLEAELASGAIPGGAGANAKPLEAPKALGATAPAPPTSAPKPPVPRPAPPPLKPPPLPGSEGARPPVPPLRPRSPATPPPGDKDQPPAGPPPLPPGGAAAPPGVPGLPPVPRPPVLRPPASKPPAPPAVRPPLRTPAAKGPGDDDGPKPASEPVPPGPIPSDETSLPPPGAEGDRPDAPAGLQADESKRLRPSQRPIAPQPPGAAEPKRRLWIIPVALAVLVALVAAAAWKLRDRPETLARNKPAEQTQAESGKIAERVGGPAKTETPAEPEQQPAAPPEKAPEEPSKTTQAAPPQPAAPATNANPAVPVAHRAALLVEAPDEPNKVKTFLGNVVWKLDNAPQGANAAVGVAVEADIDLPDDKLKAAVIFEKNADASLPASHTIKVRFTVEPGSFSGNVKQISVPQMRAEASPGGETMAGVTVPITTNSFLVGLSPGNAEAANTELIRRLQWIDIPMMLDNGKIAKLTFEKGDSGQRYLTEALEAWQKQ